jgi:hypothetical protein
MTQQQMSQLSRVGMMPLAVSRIVAATCLSATACHVDPASESGAVTDSAGIAIVTSREPAWKSGDEWRLSEEPLLQIGSVTGDSLYQLHNAHTALRLSDGRIAVANMGSTQLRYFDASGTFLVNVGRKGLGPSEWSQLYQLRRGGGDTLIVIQPTNNRSVISPSGEFVARFNLEDVSRRDNIWAVGQLSSGYVVAYSLAPHPDRRRYNPGGEGSSRGPMAIPPGYYRDQYQHFIYDMKGRMIDSVGLLPGRTEFGGQALTAFMTRGFYVVGGDKLYFGTGSRSEIWVYGFDIAAVPDEPSAMRLSQPEKQLVSMRLERIIRREPDRSPLMTQADIDAYKERQRKILEDRYRSRPEVSVQAQLDHTEFPDSMPAQARLMVDAEESIWEQKYNIPGDTLDTFAIYDKSGAWLGRLTMPPRFRVSDIGADYVLGIWRDDDDVQFVRLYRLIKP